MAVRSLICGMDLAMRDAWWRLLDGKCFHLNYNRPFLDVYIFQKVKQIHSGSGQIWGFNSQSSHWAVILFDQVTNLFRKHRLEIVKNTRHLPFSWILFIHTRDEIMCRRWTLCYLCKDG